MQVDEIVSDSEDEVSEQSATVGKRFNFDELYTRYLLIDCVESTN